MVVRAVGDGECCHAFASRWSLSVWDANLATPSNFDCDGPRAANRALHTVSWRQVPPVFSPVSARSLIGGAAAACGLRARIEGARDALRGRYDAADALLTDSGTSALILALRATVPPGGTIAYPGYSCIDLTTAALGAGMRVRLYDIDPRTLSPDLDSVSRAIDRGVDAIVVAHLYGYPADVQGVQRLASARGIPVIEDSAQGAGGTLQGVRLGSIGDISVLSFGRGKGTTTGSGGAILIRTPELAARLRVMGEQLSLGRRGGKDVGILAAQWLFSHSLLYRLPASVPILRLGEMVYHPPRRPRSMSAAAVAMLPAVLRFDDVDVASRRARAQGLIARINGSGRVVPIQPVSGGAPGFLRLAVADSTGLLAAHTRLGIIRGYPLTLAQHEPLKPMLLSGENAGPGSMLLRDRLFTLPTHSRVRARDEIRLQELLSAST